MKNGASAFIISLAATAPVVSGQVNVFEERFDQLAVGPMGGQSNWREAFVERTTPAVTSGGLFGTDPSDRFITRASGDFSSWAIRSCEPGFDPCSPVLGNSNWALELDIRVEWSPGTVKSAQVYLFGDRNGNGEFDGDASELPIGLGVTYVPGGASGIPASTPVVYLTDYDAQVDGFSLDVASLTGRASPGDVIRLRLEVHPSGYGGDGSATVFVRNLSNGDAGFSPLSTISDIPAGLADTARLDGFVVRVDTSAGVAPAIDNVTLAVEPCSPGDLVSPIGVLDLDDIDAFILAFLSQGPAADIVPPFGIVDLSDIDAFITAFAAGCP